MKRILDTLIIAALSVLALSCQEELGGNVPMNESIVLDLSSGNTKAADNDTESFVNHLDVFIFDVDGTVPGTEVFYERYTVNNAATVTLNAKRSSFPAGRKYYVYLLANSGLDVSDLEAVETYYDLVDRKQEDYNLHLTGLTNVDGAPKYFLMDAVAFQEGSSPVELNNGVASDNTVLDAVLRRAAAKVVINIEASEKVEFKDFAREEGSEGGLYYLRNMPYDTYLLAEARAEEDILTAKVRNTSKYDNAYAYFQWDPSQDSRNVTLTTYVYPHNWANQSALERETCVVMNLPMTYTDGETATDYRNSWFKIPMTDEQMFRRNNYYEVNITLNRPGAIAESTPVDLEDVYYSVIDWNEVDIYVGGDDKPKYLMVNEEYMEMRNVEVDSKTLEFASSSPVTITVKDIYYYDKFGVKTTVSPAITGTTEADVLAGNITVNSPLPTNQTIRYFTLVVTNEDGITREVQVAQYPLEYITNTLSTYSYRSDFLSSNGDPAGTATGNHYENRSSYSRFSVNYSNGTHSYESDNSGFFVSKYVNSTYTSGNSQGLSDVNYYTARSTGNFNDPYNARMYHIQIMASSGDYVLGRPKITDGITDDGEDNAKLVSPSFMIASRLGTLTTSRISPDSATEPDPEDYGATVGRWGNNISWPTGSDKEGYDKAYAEYQKNRYIKVYAEHCKQYVEVYKDPETGEMVHLNDWRLPTAAELGIIYNFQGSENQAADAIDYLLNASAYFSASGPVSNPKQNMTGTSVRCIRDAY